MAKTVLQSKCPFCKKISKEVGRYTVEGQIAIILECGHETYKDQIQANEDVEIVSSDNRSPFKYQWDTVHFLEAADCNGLCLHEQGVGKTIVELMLLKRNKDLLPALIVVPSGLRLQWMAETVRWTGLMPQVITSSQDKPLFEFFPIVIVSIDTLRLLVGRDVGPTDLDFDDATGEYVKAESVPAVWTPEIIGRFKHICVDESQKIKNSSSSRTQALRKIAALANNGKKARVICLSGTNIEKHAGEFFVTLNLVRPELFPVEATYKLHHCEVNNYGKIGGLRDPQRFKEMTKDFIIRYKRAEVLPDLPKVFRQFRLAEMEGGYLEQYKKIVQDFQEYMKDIQKVKNPTDILGYLSKMRHITGVAKVDAAAQFVEEFLLENDDDRKLVVFLHHKKAGAFLMDRILKVCKDAAFNPPLYFNPSDLDVQQREKMVEEFKKPGNRIMLASTLAAGIGLNLQFCSDCLIMERQWNPSQEEQAEGRFPRPGATMDKVNAVYLIAAGTIDDFLTTIVEEKRRNVKQTLDFEETTWDERSLMMELAEVISKRGLQRWTIGKKR